MEYTWHNVMNESSSRWPEAHWFLFSNDLDLLISLCKQYAERLYYVEHEDPEMERVRALLSLMDNPDDFEEEPRTPAEINLEYMQLWELLHSDIEESGTKIWHKKCPKPMAKSIAKSMEYANRRMQQTGFKIRINNGVEYDYTRRFIEDWEKYNSDKLGDIDETDW